MSLYKVITTSKLKKGVTPDRAIQNLGKLLNLSPEKSQKLLEKPLVFKKELDTKQAKKLRLTLEKAGLEVKIQPMDVEEAPKKSSLPVKLETEKTEELRFETQTTASQSVAAQPDDNGKQFYHKPRKIIQQKHSGSLTLLSVIFCLIATVLGSTIWAALLIAFKIEYGIATIGIASVIVAIVIAGASKLGKSDGFMAGFLCAILLVVSVLGGKFGEYSYKEYSDFGKQQSALATYSPNMDNKSFAIMIKNRTKGQVDLTNQATEVIASQRPKLEKEVVKFKKAKFEAVYVKKLASGVAVMKKQIVTSPLTLFKRHFDDMDIIFLALGMILAFWMGFTRRS